MDVIETGNVALDQAIRRWLEWDRNEKTSLEIQNLVKAKNQDVLTQLLLRRLDFGTAGLRGRMGAGFSQMNDLVVIQTAQGLLHYLLQVEPETKQRGIVVGYDGRYLSRRFGELTAAVFIASSVPVHLLSTVVATPLVPFAVTHFGCVAGVVVTASHNPKQDNGYKVYWKNGAQIISPVDKGITKSIKENLEPRESSWETNAIHGSPLLKDGLDQVLAQYMSQLPIIKDNACPPLKPVVYTAMHGVGWRYVKEAFQTAGFPEPLPVSQQQHPDPEFPTVRFPNPEEGKSALDYSILTAEEAGCDLILANDPDADRLAVAELRGNGWKIFSGNELGALLGWYMVHCYEQQHGDFSNAHMLASTVSSKILAAMAAKHGFQFHETLTGFKWMGNVACDLIAKGGEVLFAFEEAIGFMCGSAVLDKDGISAAVKVAEMAAYLDSKGMSLAQKLKQIYDTYGHHITLNSYFFCHHTHVLQSIFKRLRNFHEETDKSYPKSILNGKYKITGVRDLITGYDSSMPDDKATLPVSKSSLMVTFTFENGLVTTLRTSGTEPKIKYYTELCADPKFKNVDELNKTLSEMANAIVQEFLQPDVNNLIPRDT